MHNFGGRYHIIYFLICFLPSISLLGMHKKRPAEWVSENTEPDAVDRAKKIKQDNIIITVESDLTVHIRDVQKDQKYILRGFIKPVTAVALNADNSYLLTGTADGIITCWEFLTRKPIACVVASQHAIREMQFTTRDQFRAHTDLETGQWQISSTGIQAVSPQHNNKAEDYFGIAITPLAEPIETGICAQLLLGGASAPRDYDAKDAEERELKEKKRTLEAIQDAEKYLNNCFKNLNSQRWHKLCDFGKSLDLTCAINSLQELFAVLKDRKQVKNYAAHYLIGFYRQQVAQLSPVVNEAFLEKIKLLDAQLNGEQPVAHGNIALDQVREEISVSSIDKFQSVRAASGKYIALATELSNCDEIAAENNIIDIYAAEKAASLALFKMRIDHAENEVKSLVLLVSQRKKEALKSARSALEAVDVLAAQRKLFVAHDAAIEIGMLYDEIIRANKFQTDQAIRCEDYARKAQYKAKWAVDMARTVFEKHFYS